MSAFRAGSRIVCGLPPVREARGGEAGGGGGGPAELSVAQLQDRLHAIEHPRHKGKEAHLEGRPGAGVEEINFRDFMLAYTKTERQRQGRANLAQFDRLAAERDAARMLARSRSRPALRRPPRRPGAALRLNLLGAAARAAAQAETQSQRPAGGTHRRENGRAKFLRTCRSTGVLSVRHSDEREERRALPDLTMPAVKYRPAASARAGRARTAAPAQAPAQRTACTGTQTEGEATPRLMLSANLMPAAHADAKPFARGRQVGDWTGGEARFAWVRNTIPNWGRPVRELEVGRRLTPRTRTKNLWQRVNPGFDDRRADTGPSTRMEDFDGREEELDREFNVMEVNRSLRKITNTVVF